MRSSTLGFLKMRRHADKNRMLIAYCAIGLLLSFAQIAFS